MLAGEPAAAPPATEPVPATTPLEPALLEEVFAAPAVAPPGPVVDEQAHRARVAKLVATERMFLRWFIGLGG